MERFSPFPKVRCQYGAPMGRGSARLENPQNLCSAGPAYEYDSGGVYWGLPNRDGPVWAVWERGTGRNGVAYVRAYSAADAKNKIMEGDY